VTRKPRSHAEATPRSPDLGRKAAKARSFNSFGATETHRINVIELEPNDRATLQVMAKHYRVKSLIHFLEGRLSAEEKRTFRGSQVLFRVYED
jgi:2-oxo-4-hydroxy-4-carboxy--5-ureidoimidazoline (OHCU) decarboxylase